VKLVERLWRPGRPSPRRERVVRSGSSTPAKLGHRIVSGRRRPLSRSRNTTAAASGDESGRSRSTLSVGGSSSTPADECPGIVPISIYPRAAMATASRRRGFRAPAPSDNSTVLARATVRGREIIVETEQDLPLPRSQRVVGRYGGADSKRSPCPAGRQQADPAALEEAPDMPTQADHQCPERNSVRARHRISRIPVDVPARCRQAASR
jgi:hypothetical protein